MFSDLQGPILPLLSSNSQKARAGRAALLAHMRSLPGSPLPPPQRTHLPSISLSQSFWWGTLSSPRTHPCPGPALTSPRQSLKFPSSFMTRATSSRQPHFSTAGTSEMGMSFPWRPKAVGRGWWPCHPMQSALYFPTFTCSLSHTKHSLSTCSVPNLGCMGTSGESVTGPAFEVPTI